MWLTLSSLVLISVAAAIVLSSKCSDHTILIIESGYLIFFVAVLIPPITSQTNDMFEALAAMLCLLLLGGITGIFTHHEWILDIVSAFLFGVFVQLVLVESPVELCLQVLGLAVVTAGVARGVGLHGTKVT